MPCGQPSSAASICPVAFMSSSMACLPRMTSPGSSLAITALRSLATASGSTGLVGLDQDAAVGAHGEAGAQRLGGLRRADRHDDDLARLAGLPQAQRFLDADLVEGVHRHLDVGEIDARAVLLDADLDVVVDNPLDGHEHLHGPTPRSGDDLPLRLARPDKVAAGRHAIDEATRRVAAGLPGGALRRGS